MQKTAQWRRRKLEKILLGCTAARLHVCGRWWSQRGREEVRKAEEACPRARSSQVYLLYLLRTVYTVLHRLLS